MSIASPDVLVPWPGRERLVQASRRGHGGGVLWNWRNSSGEPAWRRPEKMVPRERAPGVRPLVRNRSSSGPHSVRLWPRKVPEDGDLTVCSPSGWQHTTEVHLKEDPLGQAQPVFPEQTLRFRTCLRTRGTQTIKVDFFP